MNLAELLQILTGAFGREAPSYLAAFFGGIISFITPCVMPLVPGYISFISGVSLSELENPEARDRALRLRVIQSTLLFILGFSLVFVAGGLTAFALGQAISEYKVWLIRAAGVVIIVLGLHMAGAFKLRALEIEKRFAGGKGGSSGRAFLLGLAFAFGWSPCLGPILGGIMGLALERDTAVQALWLMLIYCSGLALPFLLTGLAVDSFFKVFDRIKIHFRKVEIGAGAFLIMIGLLMLVNRFDWVKVFFIWILPDRVNLWG